ncbi:MAG: M28 family peptidase [Staphylothermus sp.]|nr:M28 family peptidase [Staphylothermus sp.]
MEKYFILNRDVFRKEIVTGSKTEEKAVKYLRDKLSEYVDWIEIIPTPVDTWYEEKCVLICGDTTIYCKALPYTLSTDIELEPIHGYYLGEHIALSKPADSKIVFIPYPPDPDDAKYVVLKLWRKGAEAIVFYDQLPGRYRRIVITGDEDYSFTKGSPPPIPAVSVKKEDYLKIVKENPNKCSLEIITGVIHNNRGKTLVAGINGRGEKEIHITAHHDHWFQGFCDDNIGVELLIQLASLLKKNSYPNILLISYTAEESGAPNYTSWYWSWGSRYYLNILADMNKIDNIITDINLDTIYTSPLSINANPSLMKCLEQLMKKHKIHYRGFDHPYFDSFSYSLRGVPALTIHSFNEMLHIYHTNLDDGTEFNEKTLREALTITQELIACLTNNPPELKPLLTQIKTRLENLDGLETRMLVSKLETLQLRGIPQQKIIKLTTKEFLKTIYVPRINGLFESNLLSDIDRLHKILKNIEKYIDTELELRAVDNIRLFQLPITKHNIHEIPNVIRQIIMEQLRKYIDKIDEEIVKLLMEKNLIK